MCVALDMNKLHPEMEEIIEHEQFQKWLSTRAPAVSERIEHEGTSSFRNNRAGARQQFQK